jgi:hypothetical protein
VCGRCGQLGSVSGSGSSVVGFVGTVQFGFSDGISGPVQVDALVQNYC